MLYRLDEREPEAYIIITDADMLFQNIYTNKLIPAFRGQR
jgi:hypothetical protein